MATGFPPEKVRDERSNLGLNRCANRMESWDFFNTEIASSSRIISQNHKEAGVLAMTIQGFAKSEEDAARASIDFGAILGMLDKILSDRPKTL